MTLPPSELESEVSKAKTFPGGIGSFYLLTSAKRSTHTQRKLRAINERHAAEGLFPVQLLTWEDIERIIDACPAAQDFLGVQAPHAVRTILRAELRSFQDTIIGQADQAHSAELDEVKGHLQDGKLELAISVLAKLRKTAWDRLSPRARYRWCTLLADAEHRRGNQQTAAELLIEGKSHQPLDVDAIANEIMGYEILDNREKAFELATAAIAGHPHSGPLYASAIRTSPSYSELSRLIDNVPDHLKANPEVCVSIATQYEVEVVPEKAEAAARRATALCPDDFRGWFALGEVLLGVEFAKLEPENAPAGALPVPARIEEAREAFARAIELTSRRGSVGAHALARIRRASAANFVGDTRAAHRDIEEAGRIAPSNAAVALAVAQMEAQRGNLTEAVQLVRSLLLGDPTISEARFVLAQFLWERNGAGDRSEAVELATHVGRNGTAYVEPANELAVEEMISQRRYGAALEHLANVQSRVTPCFLATMRARVEWAQGRVEQASSLATEALLDVSSRTASATVRKLAKLLEVTGRLSDALLLWQRLVVVGGANEDAHRFIDCAGRLDRDDVVLEFCAQTRNAGVFDEFLVQAELRLLGRYDPTAALDLLQQLTLRDPKNKRAQLNLVHLALRLGRTELAAAHLIQLPDVEEADAQEGALVVAALSMLGRSAEAVTYAYDLLRRHFRDHRAHRAFRDATLARDASEELGEPSSAGPGVAVCLNEVGSAGPEWFVLEDSKVPALGVENEIASDSTLARKLAGKKVGEEVVLSEGPGVRRTAMVQRLLSKHVFRVGDVWDRWELRFPDHQEMWLMRMPTTGANKVDLAPLLDILRETDRRRKKAEATYRDELIPVHLFAEHLGTSDIEGLIHIANSDDLTLRCCVGGADEYSEAVRAFVDAEEVVLDVSALTTLWFLDELAVLDGLGKRAVIVQSTLSEIQALAERGRGTLRSEGRLGAAGDEPVLYVSDRDQEQIAVRACGAFGKAVEAKCRVVGCTSLATVDASLRKFLDDAIGASALESSVLGAETSRVTWTDDGLVARLGREKFGTKRVWTQAVLRHLRSEAIVSDDRFASASARLLGWQYTFTSVDRSVMKAAGQLSEWRPDRWPLKQALVYLSLDDVRFEDAIVLSARLVADNYLETMLPETRRALVQSVSESLAQRRDAQRALAQFPLALVPAFGLNLPACSDAVQTFESWRREHSRRIVAVRTLEHDVVFQSSRHSPGQFRVMFGRGRSGGRVRTRRSSGAPLAPKPEGG